MSPLLHRHTPLYSLVGCGLGAASRAGDPALVPAVEEQNLLLVAPTTAHSTAAGLF